MPETATPIQEVPPGSGPNSTVTNLRAFYAELVQAAATDEYGADHWLDRLTARFPELLR